MRSGRVFSAVCWMIVALLLQLSGPAAAAEFPKVAMERLALRLDESDSNYTIVYERMEETQTAGAVFGLVGAVASSAHSAAEDNTLADAYRTTAADMKVGALVEQSVANVIQAREPNLLASAPAEAGHTLLIQVKNWGLTRVAFDDTLVRAFVNLRVQLLDAKGKPIWDVREHGLGKTQAQLKAFTQEMFVEEVQKTAVKTGQKVGYQIVYR